MIKVFDKVGQRLNSHSMSLSSVIKDFRIHRHPEETPTLLPSKFISYFVGNISIIIAIIIIVVVLYYTHCSQFRSVDNNRVKYE
jgi:Ca2+-dependent lipid-binding protein